MKGNILLIDCSLESPHPIIDSFRTEGYSLTSASSDRDAFAALDFRKFNLVFFFLNSTEAQFDLMVRVRERLPKNSKIFAIGPDHLPTAVQAMYSGAAYYWQETASPDEIQSFLLHSQIRTVQGDLRREETLLQLIKEIALTMELDRLVNLLVDSAMELARADTGVLFLLDEKTNMFVSRAIRGFNASQSEMEYFGLPEEKCVEILMGKAPVSIHPLDPPLLTARMEKVESLIVIPIWYQDAPLGELLLGKFGQKGHGFSPEEMQLLSLFSGEISAAVHNAITHHKTKELTIKDDLTEAYNRRFFDQFLEQEFHRATRYGSHLSLIFFDVDNLKDVNVKYGHLMGSRTLQEVAHRMIRVVRGIDKVVRYGGDEFCIVLPETDSQGAFQVADRLRVVIAGKPFRINESTQVTLTGSFGIACFPDHATTKEELIRQADRAMFSIKNRSKNAIAIANGQDKGM